MLQECEVSVGVATEEEEVIVAIELNRCPLLIIFFLSSSFHLRSVGALGTSERICNATSYGLDGCRFMCCGRGYRTIERVAEVKCNCKFVWCCQVKCQWCKSKVIEHRCN